MNNFKIRAIILSLLVGSLGLVQASSRAPSRNADSPRRVMLSKLYAPVALGKTKSSERTDEGIGGFSSPSPVASVLLKIVENIKDLAMNTALSDEYDDFFREQNGDFEEVPADLGSAILAEFNFSKNKAVIWPILLCLIKQTTDKTLKDANGNTLRDLCKICGYQEGLALLGEDQKVAANHGMVETKAPTVLVSTARAASAMGERLSSQHQTFARIPSQTVFESVQDDKDEKIASLERAVALLTQSLADERAKNAALEKGQVGIQLQSDKNNLLIAQLLKDKTSLQEELRAQNDVLKMLQQSNVALQEDIAVKNAHIDELELDSKAAQQGFLLPSALMVSADSTGYAYNAMPTNWYEQVNAMVSTTNVPAMSAVTQATTASAITSDSSQAAIQGSANVQ